jgi:hypothetical protein
MTMTRHFSWQSLFHSVFLLWHECREQFAVFCYRISQSVLVSMGHHAVAYVQARRGKPGTEPSCLNRSDNLSTRFMMSRD